MEKINLSIDSVRLLECCTQSLKQDLKIKMNNSCDCEICNQEEINELILMIADLINNSQKVALGGNEYIKRAPKCTKD